MKKNSLPAVLGGDQVINVEGGDAFEWPVITPEMEHAVLDVLRTGRVSGLDVTKEFEQEYAQWAGRKYALAHNNGTSALHSALFGTGVGCGDEIICPAVTYWASCVQVYSLGATVVFADIDPDTLCIDPNDIEHRITNRTQAIMVVHYSGMPADMDTIMKIARKHSLAVVEDVSHAHGSLYKGRLTGTFGDAAGFSLMSGKSFPIGEGGMLTTDDRLIYERAIAFAHYARHEEMLTLPETKPGAGIPWGGYKYRINQLASAVGREQLKMYPAQMEEIDQAMNYFWDLLEDVPGIRAHRPQAGSGSTKGGWYFPLGFYRSEELGGLSVTRFCESVRAEGFDACRPGCNLALHIHPLFHDVNIYRTDRPTRLAFLPKGVDIRQPVGSLPVSEGIQTKVFSIPWFKRFNKPLIEAYARAFRKIAEHAAELLEGDTGNPVHMGMWGTSTLKI